MERKEFAGQAAHLARKAVACSEKARCEGLLALEDEIDEGLAAQRDVFEYNLRLAMDAVLAGVDVGAIDDTLSQMIARETDENTRRLKTMQKAAVLCILAGQTPRLMIHELLSFLCDEDLKAVHGHLFSDIDIYRKIFQEDPAADTSDDTATDKDTAGGEFPAEAASLIRKALDFANKAKAQGFVPLDYDLDPGMIRRRDVFEYGQGDITVGAHGDAWVPPGFFGVLGEVLEESLGGQLAAGMMNGLESAFRGDGRHTRGGC